LWSNKINFGAFTIACWRLLLWTLGFLALVSLITWLSPDQSGSPTLPGWAVFLGWALLVVPVVPATKAGVARLQGREKWRPILLGAIFGLVAPILGVVSLVTAFVLFEFNIDLGFPDGLVPDQVVVVALFLVAVALGVATALRHGNAPRER